MGAWVVRYYRQFPYAGDMTLISSILEPLLEPTPHFEVWTTGEWIFALTVTALGVLAIALWPEVSHGAMVIADRIVRPVGTILSIAFVLVVIFSVLYALLSGAHQIPRHIPSDGPFLRSLTGVALVIAGIIAGWRAYQATVPGGIAFGIGLAPAVFAAGGLFNDHMSRFAAGVPINVWVIYLGFIALFFFVVFNVLRRQ